MPWGSYLKPRSLGNLFECNNSASSNYTLSSANKPVSRKPDQSRHIEIHRLRLDVWGGCLNVRKMRGGTRNSMHSWGIALDYDPQNNQLKWGSDRATFAQPDYNKWWEFWEEEGWVSLGRTRNYDWMHVQAAKL